MTIRLKRKLGTAAAGPTEPASEEQHDHPVTGATPRLSTAGLDSNNPPSNGLTREQAAEHLTSMGYTITANRLAKLVTTNAGPPCRRWRSRVYYDVTQLAAWARNRGKAGAPQDSTS
jgi:hypothetical protein